MKVGISSYPLKSAHKHRGIGVYTRNLIESLKKDGRVEVVEFEDLSKIEGVDLIHLTWFDLFFKTLPIKQKIPTIVTVHDVMPLVYPKQTPVGLKGKFNFYLQKRALKNCKLVITPSEASKKDVIKYLKIPKEKVKVIYEDVADDFKQISDSSKLLAKKKYNLPDSFLLYVGDANFVKNLPFLLKGFEEIKKSVEFKDLKLVLVGNVFLKNVENSDHPELQSLKEVNKLISKLSSEIIRPGQIETSDLVAFYNLANAYVQPSLYEGFGLPVLEAMRCGTPIISSNAGSLKEVGGEAAVYFDPTNLNQFIDVTEQVLRDKSFRNKLSLLSLKQAEKFSWERVADETIKTYS
jgi:glycosyltransferase involved in cell wall biosynthesis